MPRRSFSGFLVKNATDAFDSLRRSPLYYLGSVVVAAVGCVCNAHHFLETNVNATYNSVQNATWEILFEHSFEGVPYVIFAAVGIIILASLALLWCYRRYMTEEEPEEEPEPEPELEPEPEPGKRRQASPKLQRLPSKLEVRYRGKLKGKGVKAVRSVAENYPGCTKMELEQNKLGDAHVQELADVLLQGGLPHMKELNLQENAIGDAGVTSLARAMEEGRLGKLEILRIWGNQVCRPPIARVHHTLTAETPSPQPSSHPTPPHPTPHPTNSPSPSPPPSPPPPPPTPPLQIGDEGLEALANAMNKLPALEQLSVGHNKRVGEAGLCALAKVLPNLPSLTKLDVAPVASPRAQEALQQAAPENLVLKM